MSTPFSHVPPSRSDPSPVAPAGGLRERAARAAAAAREFALGIQQEDGHWCAELESNTTITAEYVLLRQALGLDLAAKAKAMIAYFFGEQKRDGSWGLAPNLAGDVSTTAETYLALRLLGVPIDDARMQDAERYILAHGGLEKIRMFTRIFFAMFGLVPWSALPSLPPEFILLPPSSPANVYALSSWARGTIVPLLIVCHHKPVFALPNGRSARNDWLDHLWLAPRDKKVPYSEPITRVLRKTGASWKTFFTGVDRLLRVYDGVVARVGGPLGKLRAYSLAKCEAWMLARQEHNGDWGGIFPPMANMVLALHLSDHPKDSGPLKLALEALERFAVEDERGYRIEPCQSPVWDTILMAIGLLDCGFGDGHVDRALGWIEPMQILAEHGDWRVYNPEGRPGGWSFEYTNTWYPDVDDTSAIVIGFLKRDLSYAKTEMLRRAVDWIVSMQNEDGGWAAFDRQNDREFLNEIPFSDMAALCEPSSPDVAGRVLEALGLLDDPRHAQVCARGLAYLRASQEPEGSWFGRWGVNYVFGTSTVLCALARQRVAGTDPMATRAVAWLCSVQNADGGWGECLESYANRVLMGKGRSTASQTAWALMGLLAYLPREAAAIQRGVRWLVERQTADGTWEQAEYTGTGFPNHFYLRYNLYRHYFPLMALGRFLEGGSSASERPTASARLPTDAGQPGTGAWIHCVEDQDRDEHAGPGDPGEVDGS